MSWLPGEPSQPSLQGQDALRALVAQEPRECTIHEAAGTTLGKELSGPLKGPAEVPPIPVKANLADGEEVLSQSPGPARCHPASPYQ